MDFRYKPGIRAISIIVLFFFCWTFGLCDTLYAIANSKQAVKSSQQSAIISHSAQSAQPKTQKPEERFQTVIDDIEKILFSVF
jgi:hypothetical protein